MRCQDTYAGDQEGILAGLGVKLVHGAARFVGPDEVQAGAEMYRPSHVLIATGSAAVKPPLPGFDLADTSDDALAYAHRPDSLAIVGGGYIAMELAGIYAAFGTRVTLVVRGAQVLKAFDPEAAAVAREALEGMGVTALMSTAVQSLEAGLGEYTLHVVDAQGREQALSCERVLAATGRRPAIAYLDLDAGQVDVDEHGRPVLDESLRSTSNPRVWVAGDAAGGTALTPVAGLEGELVAQSILSDQPHPVDLSGMPSTYFTVPEVARVGLGEAELVTRGMPYSWPAAASSGWRRRSSATAAAGW